MIEYLIRATDGDEFAIALIPPDRFDTVLTPQGFGATRIEGWGDHRIQIDKAQISFAAEDPGWQVTFDGEMDPAKAEAIAQVVAAQLQQESGRPHEAMQISW